MAGWFWRGSMRSWAGLYLCYGLFVKHEWLNKIEQHFIPWKVTNCCRRVGKEVVNANFLALNCFVELILSTSDLIADWRMPALPSDSLPCFLKVAAGLLDTSGSFTLLKWWSAVWKMGVWKNRQCCVYICQFKIIISVQFCIAALQWFGVYNKKIKSSVQGYNSDP